MNALRRISTGACGAALAITSVIVIPLTAASPAAATDSAVVPCTPGAGFNSCLEFGYTGADQTFTVPAGVTSVLAKVWGAGGGTDPFGINAFPGGGGGGGFTTGTIGVTPATTLTLEVGAAGVTGSNVSTYGGGGAGGTATPGDSSNGSSGGGLSAVFADAAHATPWLIAGGGGGSGGTTLKSINTFRANAGGAGGGGGRLGGTTVNGAIDGTGGTQLAGGTSSNSNVCSAPPANGSAYTGAPGGSSNGIPGSGGRTWQAPGGGGGGGWFGGGGGACGVGNDGYDSARLGGTGGGGSGYINASVTASATTAGANGVLASANALPGGATDALYVSPAGQGGGSTAGAGEIALEWSAPPSPADATSTGSGTTPQSPTLTVPNGDSVTLLDASSQPATTVRIPDEGEYSVEANVITFTPVAPFVGAATPVTFQETDSVSRTGTATYTPTVTIPAPPTQSSLTSVGDPGIAQSAQPVIPTGGTAAFSGGLAPFSLSVPQGTYTMDPDTFDITFTPNSGFSGAPDAAAYEVSDAYDQSAGGVYQPEVISSPVALPITSTGIPGAAQQVTVPLPDGGTATLLSDGDPTSVLGSDHGDFLIDPDTGIITFTPADGFLGSATVAYRITDSFNRTTDSTYTATVQLAAVAVASVTGPRLVLLATTGTLIPMTCGLSFGAVSSCNVTLSATVNGESVIVGTGRRSVTGSTSSVLVAVRLNTIGHRLAASLGGASAVVAANVTRVAIADALPATTTTRFVNNSVSANSTYFTDGSATLNSAAMRYLNTLRTNLSGIGRVTCLGVTQPTLNAYTDWVVAFARANAVCTYLTRGTKITRSLSATRQSLANSRLDRRTDIRLYYAAVA